MVQSDPSITDEGRPEQRRRLFPLALLSAVLMTCAFPPLDAGWLAWVALVPLLYALPLARRARHAFALSYLFGFIHWGWIITWIGTTVVMWAQTPLGWLAWLGLTAIKAGWFGLFGALTWWIARRREGAARILATAAAWTLIEWLRAQGSLAMPWSLAGYSQYRYLPLIQAADLGGIFLVSFALLLVNAALAEALRARVEGTMKRRRLLPLLLPSALLLGGMLAYGAVSLRREYAGAPIRLTMMQPNLTSERGSRGTPEQELAQFSAMAARLEAARQPGTEALVIWPESTAPISAVSEPTERAAFAAMARSAGAYQLVGTGYEDAKRREHNSAALFAPDGRLAGRYDKQWLVPYGEWMPGRSWMPFGDVFHFIKKDLAAGTTPVPLPAGPARLCVLICYESVFPVLSRAGVAHGANLLVSITNDSWAGQSPQLRQHIAMAVLRAVETRRYLAAAATTGITGLIAPDGRLTAAPPYREAILTADARLREGLTPYVRFGDWFVAACAVGLLLALARRPRLAAAC